MKWDLYEKIEEINGQGVTLFLLTYNNDNTNGDAILTNISNEPIEVQLELEGNNYSYVINPSGISYEDYPLLRKSLNKFIEKSISLDL